MTDTLTSQARSERMALISGKDTGPERTVRRLVHAMGYRYRLHRRDLPGKPDLVFATRRKVIFVHGCFWHRHADSSCKLARMPKSRLDFWRPKLDANVERDRKTVTALEQMRWAVLVIWECELRDQASLTSRILSFLR